MFIFLRESYNGHKDHLQLSDGNSVKRRVFLKDKNQR